MNIENGLEKELTKRLIKESLPKPRFVLFVDMLGFSALTEAHPDPVVYDFDSTDGISSETSESARQLGRFQYLLNMLPDSLDDALNPSHLMIFSDCAFAVYETALQAATSATTLMRQLLTMYVPVRMGLAYGTWHVNRFSFDVIDTITVTRAVFYGTGVVRATQAEKRGGRGCRIFVHSSIAPDSFQFRYAGSIIPINNKYAPHELNYLYSPWPTSDTTPDDQSLWVAVSDMHQSLQKPIDPDIDVQYSETLSAINRMRVALHRLPFEPVNRRLDDLTQ